MSKPGKRFRVSVSAEADLAIAEIWPDGDAPENPTADDVREKIELTCGWGDLVRDWNLPQDADVWEIEATPPAQEDDDVPY